ncbi:hypothetical protein Q8F57_015110 [Paraburkholderia terrae]
MQTPRQLIGHACMRSAISMLASRWIQALCLALYMIDPVRQRADAHLVAAYLGEPQPDDPNRTGQAPVSPGRF